MSGGLDTLGVLEAGAGAGPFDDGDFDEVGVLAVRARELFVVSCEDRRITQFADGVELCE